MMMPLLLMTMMMNIIMIMKLVVEETMMVTLNRALRWKLTSIIDVMLFCCDHDCANYDTDANNDDDEDYTDVSKQKGCTP